MAEKKTTVAEAKKSPEKYSTEWYEELIPVRLFKDNDKYSGDVTVGLNGEFIKIQRGKETMVKRKFYEVLDQSEKQKAYAAGYSEELEEELSQREKELGL